MTAGYKALKHGAAVLDLSTRTRIRATGEDRARLLHALTTNHIQQLLPGHGCYAFFLNANGRILADANVLAFPEHLLIDAEPEVRTSLWSHIDHYIIADDVNLHDDAETTFCIAVEGPHAASRLRAVGAPTPSNLYSHQEWNGLVVVRLSITGQPAFRLFGPVERKSATLDLLYLPEATVTDLETVRVENAKPRFGVDFSAAQIVAETGLNEGLHFQKGCYLGQEIVERVRSRGRVNKRLIAFEANTGLVPQSGAKLLFDGKEIGEVTSAVFSPEAQKVRGLAYARVPHDVPGTVLEVEGAIARVIHTETHTGMNAETLDPRVEP